MVMDDEHNAAAVQDGHSPTVSLPNNGGAGPADHDAAVFGCDWSSLGRLVRRRAHNAAAAHRDFLACASESEGIDAARRKGEQS